MLIESFKMLMRKVYSFIFPLKIEIRSLKLVLQKDLQARLSLMLPGGSLKSGVKVIADVDKTVFSVKIKALPVKEGLPAEEKMFFNGV